MALIVMCSTDFFGVHDSGSRAKARNEARVFQMKRQLLVAQLAMLFEKPATQDPTPPADPVVRSPERLVDADPPSPAR